MTSAGMHRRLLGILLGFLAVGAGSSVAMAGSSVTVTGGPTSQPIGHYEFCKRMPQECAIRSDENRPERMTDALRTELATVTAEVNKALKPMNDIDIFGQAEFWTYPDKVGDCEDYVLLKRRTLVEQGVALSNLLITVVRKQDGEGHAVLTVRTDQGDFVLDNLNDAVRPWQETGYRYLKRQATDDTGEWVSILEDETPLVSSVH